MKLKINIRYNNKLSYIKSKFNQTRKLIEIFRAKQETNRSKVDLACFVDFPKQLKQFLNITRDFQKSSLA